MKVTTMTPDELQDVLDSFRTPSPQDARQILHDMHPGMFEH
jgi:hypothetical protein